MADKNFEIWQLKEGAPDTPQMLFTNYDYMTKHGFLINTGIYDCVYAGMTAVETTPEDIYVRFNINHPEDYRAHSLSESDVVVFKEGGKPIAYFWTVSNIKSCRSSSSTSTDRLQTKR